MRSFIALLLIAWCALAPTQAQVITWQHAYGTATDEEDGFAVAMPAGGSLLLGHQSYLSGAAGNLYFVRLNAQGDTLWTKRFDPPHCVNAAPRGMLVDAAGNVLVTGLEYWGNVGFAVKLTPACDTIWTRTLSGAGTRVVNTSFNYPTVAPDGNYVVLQSVFRLVGLNGSVTDQSVLKLSARTGQTVWSRDLGPLFATAFMPGSEELQGIGRTPTGFMLFVMGALPNPQRGLYGTLILDDAGNLGRLRLRPITQVNQVLSFPCSLLDRQGNTVVATRQNLTKLTPIGDTLFSVSPPPTGLFNDTWDAAAVLEDRQGNYVVLGNTTNTLNGNDFHLARFRPNGQLVKDTLLYQQIERFARSLALAPNGEFLLSGFTNSGSHGGRDLVALQFSGFRPLASRPGRTGAAGLQLYPNPAAGATVTLVRPTGSGGGEVTVYDGLGRQYVHQAVRGPGNEPIVLPVAHLPPGLYLVRYQTLDGPATTTRLVRP